MYRNNSGQFITYLLFALLFVVFSCKKGKTIIEEDPVVDQKRAYISKIFEYRPAPGQFINDNSYGTLAKAQSLIGSIDNGLLSLGGYGGYIVFGFDHPIENKGGYDLGIYGNSLIGTGMEWSEPGIVCVMQDKNKNGQPDDGEWLELAGSEYNDVQTVKKYQITYYKPSSLSEDIRWTDNQGKTGYILRNSFHTQDYFPAGANTTTILFEGTLLKNTLAVNGLTVNKPFTFGYSDSGTSEYLSLQKEKGRGYNTFDIDWAVDANGNKVNLTAVDFVKVYTAQNSNGNPYHPDNNAPQSRSMGEISTEIGGAIDLHFK